MNRRHIEPGPGAAEAVIAELRGRGADIPDVHGETTLDVDMTNWLRIVGDTVAVKFAAEPGALDRSTAMWSSLDGAGIAPRLFGWLEDDGTVTAVATEYLTGSTDGWTWAVDDVGRWMAGGPYPTWPQELGALVARLHLRLAEAAAGATVPAPAPDPRPRARHALADAVALNDPVISARSALLADVIESLPSAPIGRTFPIHGDLHVGQFLRVADGYRIIDFDGDPTLPAAERGRPDLAARDIAHLLTSIDLVASVAQRRLGRRSAEILGWADDAHQAMLDAYRADAGDLLDASLLPGLQAEQLLREFLYADRFLPRWHYAAAGALTHRFPISEEDPWTPIDSSTT